MAACKVKESVWFFAKSSGGFESKADGFPVISSEQKTIHATIARAGMAVFRAGARRDIGNSEASLIPPDATWNPGHRRSSRLQVLSCRNQDPFRKWLPIRRQ